MAKKDAKHHAASNNKSSHSTPPQQQQQKAHKKESPKKDEKKTAEPRRGFFSKLFGFIWSCVFYLTIILATSSTIAIGLDCAGKGTPIPGSAPLCKDISLIGSGNKPSANFAQNVKKTYGTVFNGYHAQAQPHLTSIHSSISKQWKQFTKSDFGKQVEQVLFKVHAWIVDKWVKTQRFVQAQWANVNAWWKKDGQKTFGPALEGFKLGLKMVFQFVLDILSNVATLLMHFAVRVKTFFVALADGGFNAAMKTLNH